MNREKHGPTERWRKSSHSTGQNGNCVELSNLGAVRDSKNPAASLSVDVAALVAAAKGYLRPDRSMA
jgi:hypothetical protein